MTFYIIGYPIAAIAVWIVDEWIDHEFGWLSLLWILIWPVWACIVIYYLWKYWLVPNDYDSYWSDNKRNKTDYSYWKKGQPYDN
jgi:hypothetical protein